MTGEICEGLGFLNLIVDLKGFQIFWMKSISDLATCLTKGLELLRINGAKPMQKCFKTFVLQNVLMQIFFIPMLIEEYEIRFSTL